MPNSPLLKYTDKQVEAYAKALDSVLSDLESRVLSIINSAKIGQADRFDATAILNSRTAMIQALREAGYSELAENHIAKYEDFPGLVKNEFAGFGLPDPRFTGTTVEVLRELAGVDLDTFSAIGEEAVDKLRTGLYKDAVARQPFSELVAQVKAATTGTDIKGSPLKNYSYTHANTAMLNFSGEVVREAGESINAEYWEVVGPLDSVTRPACVAALRDPIRKDSEWKKAGYWGGTPGGWN
jgi:hypothetical protein